MAKAMRWCLGAWLLLLVAGCTVQTPTGPTDTARQECERAGGVWRTSQCEHGAGGGY